MTKPPEKIRPKDGMYYDLIHVPHGHIPAPKANLWSAFPIAVRETRGEDYYSCPECGEPSFFKIETACRACQNFYEYDCSVQGFNAYWRRAKRRWRRTYFRNFWKRLEYLFLPVLLLLGRAWYVRSKRASWRDYWDKMSEVGG